MAIDRGNPVRRDVNPVPPDPVKAFALASAIGSDFETVRRLLPVCCELVEHYAGPDTPPAILWEAVIRCAGWLYEHPADGTHTARVGDLETRYLTGKGALRNSGAMALLGPWKVRRAAVCE